MLEFKQVQKSYGNEPILTIPVLQLEKGIYWLQGVNGSGKTTLFRMIAGLVPFTGELRMDGVSLQAEPLSYRRLVSWADAEPLYPDFITGEDLIAFYREIRQPAAGEVEQLAERFGMRSYLSTPLGKWSSGMTKKLSLLLAFMGRSSWILLDEPLVTLDRETLPELYAMIGERHRQGNVSFLFSSHQEISSGGMPSAQKLQIRDKTIQLIV
jgi:ABC-2 type transport system ATP-binding protein